MAIRASATHVVDFAPQCWCGGEAKVFLLCHRTRDCEGAEEPLLLCRSCLTVFVAAIQECLLEVFIGFRESECEGCGKPLVTLSDVITRLTPLSVMGNEHERQQ